jgi:predicted glycosyltransferase
MRLWIDLANSPHVPFFTAVKEKFVARGHEVEMTARDFAETVPLANAAGLSPQVIGGHGGREIAAKAGNLVTRAWALVAWARKRQFDLAVSHNSYSQILAARVLRLKNVTLMDYEYQPANHLAFRLSRRIIVPQSFPAGQLQHFGARPRKVRRYHGTKEDVYLANFQPDPNFAKQLTELGIGAENVLVLLRPPAAEALYHRFENTLFAKTLAEIQIRDNVRVVLLPRSQSQRDTYATMANANVIIPPQPLDGPNLIAASDLVISAGGTINREAAALGVPAASTYAGKWAAVDEQLVNEGRLWRISNADEIAALQLQKKATLNPRRSTAVIDEVVNLILE